MPKHHSRFRRRDKVLSAHWDESEPGLFAGLALTKDQIKAAQAKMVGQLLLPGQPAYESARRLFNPWFNPFPLLIVMCESDRDVAIGLALAQLSGLPFSVRSGGHSTAGFSAGPGVLIDVSGLDMVLVDTRSMTVTAGTGCPFRKLYSEMATYGVHVPAGECDDVCVGGFVQGGGLGFTSPSFGMNCDNVTELRVMLADGSIVIANATQNYDLYWSMLGGTGGNFGVLLSVTYSCRVIGDVSGIALAWPMSTAAEITQIAEVLQVLQQQFFADTKLTAKLNLQALILWQTILDPKKPPLAAAIPVFMVRGLWIGDPDHVRKPMQPLYDMGAIEQFVVTGSYDKVLNALSNQPQDQPILAVPNEMPFEGKASRYVSQDLTVAQWTEILGYFTSQSPNQMSYMYLEVYGGAIRTAPMDTNAFIHRDALYDAVLDVFWYDPADQDAAMTFLQGWITLMEKVWNNEVYQNYPSLNVPDFAANYWGSALTGLVQTKAKYDPQRSFTFAQAVPAVADPVGPVPPKVAAALTQPINRTGGAPAPKLDL
jgi:hypothetical protein